MRFTGKTVLVTGSTSGIGAAIARRFGADGANVVVTGRRENLGTNVADEVNRAGGSATYVPLDLADERSVEDAMQAAVDEFGSLDVLVNNAAPTEYRQDETPIADMTNETWDEFMKAGVYGLFWSCKFAIRHLMAAGGGSIVNISSTAGTLASPASPAYVTIKGAMNALTRQIAVDYAPHGIRCNAISVGFVVSTPRAEALANHPVAGPALRAQSLTRFGEPNDIAAAAAFLASDDAAFITGSVLFADGGISAKVTVPNLSVILADHAAGDTV